jgi:hypothetical protein
MKFLVMWSWSCENSQKVTERFSKWKPLPDTKLLYPIHTVIGANWAFSIAEADKAEAIAMEVQPWTDICTYEILPIMDSRELVAALMKTRR